MGVRVFNIDEAKANLSKLVDAAIAGEEIIIARNGRRLVKMLRYDEQRICKRSDARDS